MSTAERILNAAVKLFATEGFPSVTMRKVAQAVGVSAPALYRHYPSKDHLMLEVVKQGFDKFLQYQMKALQGKTPWERMQISGEAYFDFANTYPDYYRLIFQSEWTPEDPAIREHMSAHGTVSFRFLVDRVRELLEGGYLTTSVPAESVAFTIWSVVHGTVSLALCGVMDMKGVNARWQFDQALIALFQGLGSEKLLSENEIVRHKTYA